MIEANRNIAHEDADGGVVIGEPVTVTTGPCCGTAPQASVRCPASLALNVQRFTPVETGPTPVRLELPRSSGSNGPIVVRLWSLHPSYLDSRGLVALWRESLLARAVLLGRTAGYRHHPQVLRFLEQTSPVTTIDEYLRGVHAESVARGYRFDGAKIMGGPVTGLMEVPRGQLVFEWRHLTRKLEARAPDWLEKVSLGDTVDHVRPHPLFRVVEGPVASWERV